MVQSAVRSKSLIAKTFSLSNRSNPDFPSKLLANFFYLPGGVAYHPPSIFSSLLFIFLWLDKLEYKKKKKIKDLVLTALFDSAVSAVRT